VSDVPRGPGWCPPVIELLGISAILTLSFGLVEASTFD
jgi:hypothetical protein